MPQEKKIDAVYINTDQSIKVSEDIFWKPVRTYFYYLMSRVFKMASTYIIAVLGLAGCLLVTILPIFMEDQAKAFAATMVLTLLSLFVIIFAGTFGISKSLNIFTEFETDGSELLVISKSISRSQIITVKFIFLLIMGLVFSALITAMVAIGFTIVGWDLYKAIDTTAVLVGSFTGSLMSYCFMGMLSIAIGLKVSGKLARGLPSAVLSFSSVLAMLGVNLFTFISPNPPVNFWPKLTESVNTSLKTSPVEITMKDGSPAEVSEVKIDKKTFGTDLMYFYNLNDHLFYYETYSYKIVGGDSFQTADLQEKPATTDQTNLSNLTKFITTETANFLNENPIGPTASLAVNFINPISAFATISGSTISAEFTSNTGQTPYNYSFSEYVVGDKPILRPTSFGEIVPITHYIKVNKVFQWDQNWIIGLLWGGLFIVLSIFTIAAYFRKDFK